LRIVGCKLRSFFFFFSSRRRHTRWPRDWFRRVLFRSAAWRSGEVVEVMTNFAPQNFSPERQAALKMVVADARRFVRTTAARYDRSEERRVGKECSCWRWADH